MQAPALTPTAALVRRHDPDRFLTALFAPPESRETLLLLYAFNHELARAREVASQPLLALIRLQWWREVVEGQARRHEVATPLAAAIADGRLASAGLLAMIEGREAEVEGEDEPSSLAAWQERVRATAGALAAAAGDALGADAALAGRLQALGAAYGVAGQLRSIAALARQGRCLLPDDVMGAHGLTRDAVIADPSRGELLGVRATLARIGQDMLAAGGGPFPGGTIAAALPGVLARGDLRRPGSAAPRGLGARMAVMIAALRHRV